MSEVEVTDGSSQSAVAQSQMFEAAGVTAQQVHVASDTGFDFHWKGRAHYLALHDLNHVDAETFSDAQPVDRRRDLRGRITFVASGCGVWGWSTPTIHPQSFTALYLDPEQMEKAVAEKLVGLEDASKVYFTNPALQATLEKLRRGLGSNPRPDAMYMESLCLVALLELCMFRQESLAATTSPVGRLARPLQQKLVDYVEAHLTRDIGLNDLAEIAGLSRYHFLRAFKRTTGRTPYHYLLERRVAMAQRLLREGSLSVAAIAGEVGFKESTRLIRAFRKITGVTPGAYRAS